MLKRTIATVFVTALLCLFALPVTALAAGTDSPNSLYVGNTNLASTIYPDNAAYWTSSDGGTNWTSQQEEPTGDSYIYYDGQGTLTLHNANIQGQHDSSNGYSGYGIYAVGASGSAVSLTIKLEGTNTVSGMYGIDVSSSGGDASLNISGSGSLTVSATAANGIGIFVQAQSDANLTIDGANVNAVVTETNGRGVELSTGQAGSPNLTIEVKGGNLQASGQANGIKFFTNADNTRADANLKVSGNAMVKTSGITTDADGSGSQGAVLTTEAGTDETGGIVWNGSEGTVYGSVTLQDDLTIGAGESLTLDDGASLNAGNHNVIVDGGTLDESLKTSLGDRVTYVVRGVSLDQYVLTLIEGGTAQLTATVEPSDATNKKVTWSSSAPGVATVDANGNVTAMDAGAAVITVTTEDGNKTATCTVTVEHAHDPAAAWSSDASGHWHACAGCGEKLDFAPHSNEVAGKQDATCTEDGYTGDTVCPVCGYVVAGGVAIPATGHSYQNGVCTACGAKEPAKDEDAIPATGDLAPMACALLGIFGIAFVVAGLRNRTSW